MLCKLLLVHGNFRFCFLELSKIFSISSWLTPRMQNLRINRGPTVFTFLIIARNICIFVYLGHCNIHFSLILTTDQHLSVLSILAQKYLLHMFHDSIFADVLQILCGRFSLIQFFFFFFSNLAFITPTVYPLQRKNLMLSPSQKNICLLHPAYIRK